MLTSVDTQSSSLGICFSVFTLQIITKTFYCVILLWDENGASIFTECKVLSCEQLLHSNDTVVLMVIPTG